MNSRRARFGTLLLAFASCMWDTAYAQQPVQNTGRNAMDVVFDIPRVSNITLDGNLDDWGEKGLQILTLSAGKGMPWPKASSPAGLRLGWNDSGLLLGVTVHHADRHEHDYVRHLFKGDSVEVFVAPAKGSRDRYMLVVSPGLDQAYSKPRSCFFVDPSEEGEREVDQLKFQLGRSKTEDGYTMELLLPWSNLNLVPRSGMELALQVYVMESDGKECLTAMWHPAGESHVDPYAVHRARLVDRGSRSGSVSAPDRESG